MERITPVEPPYEDGIGEELSRDDAGGRRAAAALPHPGPQPPHPGQDPRGQPAGSRLDRAAGSRDRDPAAPARAAARSTSGACTWRSLHDRFGISDEKISGHRRGGPGETIAGLPRERVLVRLADELHEGATVSDELWSELRDSISKRTRSSSCSALVGFYHTISFVTNGLAIELEATAAALSFARGCSGKSDGFRTGRSDDPPSAEPDSAQPECYAACGWYA